MSALLLLLNSASASTEKFISRDNIMRLLQRFEYSAKAYLDERKKQRRSPQPQVIFSLQRWVVSWLYFFWKLPIVIMYYTNIAPAMFIIGKVTRYVALALKILSRRSSNVRHTVGHIVALLKIFDRIRRKIATTELSELVLFGFATILEILCTVLFPGKHDTAPAAETSSLSEYQLSELLSYEEIEDAETAAGGESDILPGSSSKNPYLRSLRAMHHAIPSNPFKATIRIYRTPEVATLRRGAAANNNNNNSSSNNYNSSTINSSMNASVDCISDVGAIDGTLPSAEAAAAALNNYLDADSPASFPPTPFSRAVVMNRASERTVSVMFAARDRLRLEAQSVSRDEYSRMVAKEAQTSGQFAVFDHRQTSDGIALTCGNHCAIKVGRGLCCCCRSMVPVRTDTYVYFEFSITVSSAQIPTLGLGLSPPDCPLNVMVGSWPRSVGLYSDGQVLIGSHWFQSLNRQKIEAGSTVGMLVHMPTIPPRVEQSTAAASNTTAAAATADTDTSPEPATTSLLGSWFKSLSGESDKGGKGDVNIVSPPHVTPDSQPATAAAAVREDRSRPSSMRKPPSHASIADSSADPRITFQLSINGERVQHPPEALDSMGEVVSLRTPMYPTVSLFSEDTRVWCRFCEADVVYRSRAAIGAPAGVRVYCLDGSLLLEEGE